jgi:hypothetical protein
VATSPPGLNHIRARVPPRLRWPRASHYRPLSGSRTRGDARPSRLPLCLEVGCTCPGALEADGDTIQARHITSRAHPATSAAQEASPPQPRSITHNWLLGADSGSQGHRSSLGQNRQVTRAAERLTRSVTTLRLAAATPVSLCCRMAFAGNPLAGPRGGRPRGLRWQAEASSRSALPLTRGPTRRAAVLAARGTGRPAARRAPPSWGGGRSRGPCVAGVSRGLRDRLVAVRPVMTGAWPHALTPTAL